MDVWNYKGLPQKLVSQFAILEIVCSSAVQALEAYILREEPDWLQHSDGQVRRKNSELINLRFSYLRSEISASKCRLCDCPKNKKLR